MSNTMSGFARRAVIDLAACEEFTRSEPDDSVRHVKFVVLLRWLLYLTRG